MDMTKIIEQMMVLFLMLLVGYILGKRKIFTKESNKVMSRVVIYVANPALLINTVTGGKITGTKMETVTVIGVSVIYFIFAPILAKAIAKMIGFSRKNSGVYEAMYCFSNLGFMGIPVMNAIYGASAIFYISIFMIPFNFLVYTYGIVLLSEEQEKSVDWKKICNPMVVSALVTLIIYFFDIKTPNVFNETVALLGGMTTPLAMITIGSTLSLIPMKAVFFDWRMYVVAMVKLLVFPMITYFVFRLFIQNSLLLGVMTVISAMPVASNVTIICNEYGGDSMVVSKGTFITTLLSLLTIPILAATIL